MLKGCSCGSRLFKQSSLATPEVQPQVQPESVEEETNDDIAILIKEKGVYSVNLKTLTGRESTMDPLFVQDTSGKINVILNPDA